MTAPPVASAIVKMSAAIERAIQKCPAAAFEIICAVVEDGRAGCPLPVITQTDDDAHWWAGLANTIELEAYLYAIAARLAETEMHSKTRKRLVAKLFTGMAPADQVAFLAWASKKEKT
tara:strand:+ start:1775 stop:2128 length:354 start_codon:yes stop_codon:yes gene_type:complete